MNKKEEQDILALILGSKAISEYVIPYMSAARDISTALVAATLKQSIKIPQMKFVKGFLLNIRITPTGTGTGTGYVSDIVKRVTIRNENREVVFDAAGEALGIGACLGFAIEKMQARETGGRIVAGDAVVATSATTYDMFAYVPVNAKGVEFDADVSLNALGTVLPTTMTGVSVSVRITAFADDKPAPYDAVVMEYLTTNLDDMVKGVIACGLALDGVELSTVLTAFKHGPLSVGSAGDIQEAESIANSFLEGTHAAGVASAGVYQLGINSLRHATQDMYAVISEQDEPETFEYKFSSGQTVYYYARYNPSKV